MASKRPGKRQGGASAGAGGPCTDDTLDLNELESLLGERLPRARGNVPLVEALPRTTPHGTFWNIKVCPTRNGRVVRRAADDATYADFPALRRLVPRLFVVAKQHAGAALETVIAELPKFDALSAGDADEEDATSSSLTDVTARALQAPGLSVIEVTEKANGHTVVFRMWRGLLVGGTKACTWAVPWPTDATQPELPVVGADAFPSPMVHDAFVALTALAQSVPSCDGGPAALRALLCARALVGEHETNQHIRFYERPGLVFFDPDLPPFLRRPVVACRLATPAERAQLQDPAFVMRLRTLGNWEGWVLVGRDAAGAVLWRYKLKTVPYTLLRMLREMYSDEESSALLRLRVELRAYQRNAAFLHAPVDTIRAYVVRVLFPLVDHMVSTGVKRDAIAFHGTGFAPVIAAFCRDAGIDDAFVEAPSAEQLAADTLAGRNAETVRRVRMLQAAITVLAATQQTVLVTWSCFAQGTGKNTASAAFVSLLGAAAAAVVMDQDTYGGDANAFYPALSVALQAPAASTACVVLARCNMCVRDRARVLAVTDTRPVLAFEPHAGECALLRLLCMLHGVLQAREGHPLNRLSVPDRMLAVGNFLATAQPLREFELQRSGHAEVWPLRIVHEDAVLPDALQRPLRVFMAAFVGAAPSPTPKFSKKWPCGGVDARELADAVLRCDIALIRLPPAAVAAQMLHAWQHFGTRATTPVLYVAVELVEQAGDASPLVAVARGAGFVADEGGMTVHAHHVTLAFRPAADTVTMYTALEGTVVRVAAHELVMAADRSVVAARVGLQLDGGPAGVPLTVESGVPHMTVACAPGVAPKMALEVLADPARVGRTLTLDPPITLTGKVVLHRDPRAAVVAAAVPRG